MIDNLYIKRYRGLNREKLSFTVLDLLLDVIGSAVCWNINETGVGSNIGVPIADGTAFLFNAATSETNE